MWNRMNGVSSAFLLLQTLYGLIPGWIRVDSSRMGVGLFGDSDGGSRNRVTHDHVSSSSL